MEEYPKYLTPGFEPFDPLQLAEKTEEIVSKGDSRKYTSFYCTGVYGGISTGYLVGCCLRCIFCWVDFSRDFPFQYGRFYSPKEVFDRLMFNAKKSRVNKLRISGGEPTLCKEHLLGVLRLISTTKGLFILETNGILLGSDPNYAKSLAKYPNIHVRVSLKAGTPEGFQERTGAKGEFYELPYLAIKFLREAGVNFHVATMSDSRLMSQKERGIMIQKLKGIGYHDYLEEELCDPYQTAVIRLKESGFGLKW